MSILTKILDVTYMVTMVNFLVKEMVSKPGLTILGKTKKLLPVKSTSYSTLTLYFVISSNCHNINFYQ